MLHSRSLATGVAAVLVAATVVGCSQSDQPTVEAPQAGETQTPSQDEEQKEETTEVSVANGSTAVVPHDLAVAIGNQTDEWGQPQQVEEFENGYLVVFLPGHYLVYSKETKVAAPVHGKIGETWMSRGGMNSDLGLPTAPEKVVDNGWTQSFDRGVINWVMGSGGEYKAEILPR